MIFLTFLGILIAPIFTLGCILIHYNHEWLGLFAIIISLINNNNNNNNNNK